MCRKHDLIINSDTFDQRFKPIPNHIDRHAGVDFGSGGCLFETFGDELSFVRSQPADHIWTMLDGEDEPIIVSGYHRCNRIGHIVTKQPVPENECYTVTD